MPLLLIEYDDGRILPQALVAVRRRSFLFIERGWNSPIWGYMEEIDEYIIRLRGYRENFGPWIERETTILRDSISEVYVTTEELRQIQQQLERENERWRQRREWHHRLLDMQRRGILSRGSRPLRP